MSILFALVAALLFALGSALQRRAGAGRLGALARRPPWLVGVLADAFGYGCQAAALAVGRLAIVQPLLASTIVFALPLEGWRRVTRGEWVAAVAVAAGLAVFVLVADPAGGSADASAAAWLAAFAACAAVCLVCRRGALPLGCATGVLFGLSAALTKATVARFDGGLLHAVLDWHVVALVVVGYVGLERAQASLQAGSLGTAVAAQMALDAITSVTIGVLAFGERIHATAAGGALALTGVALAIAGIVRLAAAAPDLAAR